VYRTNSKIYFEATPNPGEKRLHHDFLSPNVRLVLELSEKLTIKHLVANENDYSLMIANLLIIANNQLKIEKTNEYLVADVHSTRGFFAY
jgi:hypothetical protein